MQTKTKKFHIMTFGCQMNHSDSERLKSLLERYGFKEENNPHKSDLLIFNTCSVKQKAEDKVLGQMKHIAKIKHEKPAFLTAITGCMTRITSTKYSEKKDNLLKRLNEIDFVFQIKDMPQLGNLIREVDPEINLNEIEEAELGNYFKIQPKYSNTFQAYLPIMTGCDKFCTYCIVPYSRGREMSRPIEQIYKEAVQLVENGCKEITLLGQNVNSYGQSWIDKKSGKFTCETNPFVQLLRKLDSISGLKRLRFTSPHPQDMTPDVVDTITCGRTLMPYIHLPLQSGSDTVLKRMNRNYDTTRFLEIVNYIRHRIPACSISTDMIVGFCGETEKEHRESCEFFKRIGFDLAYISRFSARKNTIAGKLMKDDVPREVKSRRWHEMNNILRETSRSRCEFFKGATVNVLVERYNKENNECRGRTEHYKEVYFKGDRSLIGEIVEVEITEAKDWILLGDLKNH